MVDNGKKWVPDPEHGFLLGRMVDFNADSMTIEPFDTPGKVSSDVLSPSFSIYGYVLRSS